MGRVEMRLNDLGWELPTSSLPGTHYLPFVQSGNLMFLAGQPSQRNGERRFVGKLGREFDVSEGQEAARWCALNVLAQARTALGGDLDRLVRVIRVDGYVNSAPGFRQQAEVMNAASDRLAQVLEEAGHHRRVDIGVRQLPHNAAVEVRGVFEFQ